MGHCWAAISTPDWSHAPAQTHTHTGVGSGCVGKGRDRVFVTQLHAFESVCLIVFVCGRHCVCVFALLIFSCLNGKIVSVFVCVCVCV